MSIELYRDTWHFFTEEQFDDIEKMFTLLTAFKIAKNNDTVTNDVDEILECINLSLSNINASGYTDILCEQEQNVKNIQKELLELEPGYSSHNEKLEELEEAIFLYDKSKELLHCIEFDEPYNYYYRFIKKYNMYGMFTQYWKPVLNTYSFVHFDTEKYSY